MNYKSDLAQFLLQFLNERRRELLEKDLSIRSRHLCLVLEDFYHPHNISAAIRSSDCFGLLDIHIVENTVHYERNPGINKGSDKWMHIHRYNKTDFNTPECLTYLRNQGYKMIGTSPHEGSVDLRELPLDQKLAVVMGAESYGVSDYVMDNADGFVKIETPGFTESLNVSVAAGIILEHLSYRMRREEGIQWQLNDSEREELYLKNISKMVDDVHLLEKQFRLNYNVTNQDPIFPYKPARRSSEIH